MGFYILYFPLPAIRIYRHVQYLCMKEQTVDTLVKFLYKNKLTDVYTLNNM